MTYCVALNLDTGLVFASDSRTSAGVDYVTSFSKMHGWHDGFRQMFRNLPRFDWEQAPDQGGQQA